MQIINMEERLENARDVLAKMSQGDLNVTIEVENFTDALAPLEIGINCLITDLRETFESNQAKTLELIEQRRELEKKLETIEKQGQVIRKLSTPIMEIWDGILVLPIIGEIDASRSLDITDSLLARIHDSHKAWAIIDVTGVERMDAETAGYLEKMTTAVSLLGTRTVLTGIQAAVAQTLVRNAADLGKVTICKDLKDGLELCLVGMGMPSAENTAGR